MRFDVIGLVAGWSLVLLTIPLTISAIIGSIMGGSRSSCCIVMASNCRCWSTPILVWSHIPRPHYLGR